MRDRIRREPAIANVPVVVLDPFRYRKVCHVEAERVLLTRHMAQYLLAEGSIVLLDGGAEKVYPIRPIREFRCRVVRVAGELARVGVVEREQYE